MVAEEKEHRVYPSTYSAVSVLDVIKAQIRLYGIGIRYSSPVNRCLKTENGCFAVDAGGNCYTSGRLLISTGGAACRKLGGNGSGYELLRHFGHTVTPVRPSLVPLTTEMKAISGLAGIRARCTVTLFDRHDHMIHREKGEVLFTDYGISGICVMQCSRFIDGDGYYAELNFSDHDFETEDDMIRELKRRRDMFRMLPSDVFLTGILHSKLAFAVMKQAGFPLRGETLGTMNEDIVSRTACALSHYRIRITGTRPLEDAQVTAGGVSCDEFNPQNMESRLVPGLHAAGEILDTDGDCGGFNLMFAFGSGILAGLNNRKDPRLCMAGREGGGMN